MPHGTLDRSAPPLFSQGPSALSRLIFFSALALFLMVADARFDVVGPLRAAVGTVLYPVQWLAMKPVQAVLGARAYWADLATAQQGEAEARRAMVLQAERAQLADELARENARLRALLELRQATVAPGRTAEVLFDAPDPYTRKVLIDQGLNAGIAPGSPVIDARGVLGQVTLVQPFSSEVTLVVDRELSIPVQNTRTGARSVAFGDAGGEGMELRFTSVHADVQEGDLLATSGVDGVYAAGTPVARVARIERRADSAFARIWCQPLADVVSPRYVMVLAPLTQPAPAAGEGAGPAGPTGPEGAAAPPATEKPPPWMRPGRAGAP